jgi:hypothetical protein
MKNVFLILCLFATSALDVCSQSILWDSVGDRRLTFLKGEKKMNVEYSYEGLRVNGKTEQEFLAANQEEINDRRDGKGDSFVAHWQDVKGKRYPKHFEVAFKNTARKNMNLSQGNDQKYTLLVRLVKAQTGEGNYAKTKPAIAEFEISFRENSTQKILAKGRIVNAKGIVKAKAKTGGTGQIMRIVAKTMNIDVANRIANCYDAAAITTAKYVIRYNKAKKK